MQSSKIFANLLLSLLYLTLVSAGPRYQKANYFGNYINSGKSVFADPQLVINQPQNNAILVANNTFVLDVSSVPPSAGPVNITTTFVCTSGVFTVYSDINDPTTFLVPPDASGTCTVSSSAPSYTPSDPITVFLQVPMYYEGTDDSVLQTGQTIDILVRPSNNASFPTIFRIQCGTVIKDIPITTTVTTQYTLPSDLTGQCNFTTPNPPTNYLPITPVEVEIDAVITFVSPPQNTVYPAGSTVSIRTQTSDGSNPVITVELICEGVPAATLTQPVSTIFNFAPNPKIYGSCIAKIADTENYVTDSTLNFGYKVSLNFASPIKGTVAATGIPFPVQVTGTSGPSSTVVQVTGTCSNGGSFTQTVNLNQLTQFTLAPGYTGRCDLVASVSNPYFSTASTFITVFVPITPQQSAQTAQSVAFFTGTIDITFFVKK